MAGLKTTPLTAWHRAHGAKMVPFAGYEMPVQYEGVLAEHAAVRERVGLFDITHMGEIFVDGPGAEAWLDGLVTNRVAGVAVGKVTYTAMCKADGGVLDDMLIYRLGAERWLVVCNASNHDKIAAWLRAHAPASSVRMDDRSDATALIAVQGPDARELVGRVANLANLRNDIAALDFYTAFACPGASGEWIVSRTGYTGEHGYELYLPNADALAVWEELLSRGADLGVAPIGLAARDTLRFEVCYCLYGHELEEDITPLEAGIGWAVKLKKDAFTGLEALRSQQAAGVPRKLVCLEVTGRGIARQGARILSGGRDVGFVTSGTFSPTLKKPLALALVEAAVPAGDVMIDIRGKGVEARTTAFPFLAARTKGDPKAPRQLT
ncbi:MAG: glycine cleavage system aminomethyltransferase GcvT [bacterium]|nr:glycine cleavage system aminomethyltransferase GcvT [bacterium]